MKTSDTITNLIIALALGALVKFNFNGPDWASFSIVTLAYRLACIEDRVKSIQERSTRTTVQIRNNRGEVIAEGVVDQINERSL